ncbi:MAG: DUF1800 domain-containing protein [Actinomycetota bacterium]
MTSHAPTPTDDPATEAATGAEIAAPSGAADDEVGVVVERRIGRRRLLAGLLGTMGTVATAGTGCSLAGLGGEDDGGSAGGLRSAPQATALLADDPDLHLLRRLTYGPTAADLARLAALGPDGWLAEQLDGAGPDASEVEAEVSTAYPELAWTTRELIDAYQADGNGQRLSRALPAAQLLRHQRSPAQLHERLVEFWGDHFNVPQANPRLTAARIEMDAVVFRPWARGRFDDLLVATAQSPAMLVYLDNAYSRADAINENYARELLELHTVGVGGGYDEDDVVAVARLFTGWGFDNTGGFAFRPGAHDGAPQSILGWDRPGGGDPVEHGVAFLRHLARLPQTAAFVSRKLAVRFVADDPDPDLVAAMADAWLANDTDIPSVIRAMVGHPAFAAAPPKFNRPWDYLVQTMRALDVDLDVSFPPDLAALAGALADLGQIPFHFGTPDGFGDTEADWLSGGGLLSRWNVTAALTGLATDDGGHRLLTALPSLLDGAAGARASAVFDHLTAGLRHASPTDELRTLLETATGWSDDHVPGDDELTAAGPVIAFVLLTHTSALYR